MTGLSWIRRLLARKPHTARRAPTRLFRPALEALEERWLPSATWYVNGSDTTGNHTGTSWANAFTSLQTALLSPKVAAGDQIWVAKGTYKPTSGTDQTISFNLDPGVAVYGGFAGAETQLSQRKVTQNVTILSGEIGDPKTTADNSYHVVTSSGLDQSAVLDGFTITAGNADGSTTDQQNGGGIDNSNSSPTLTNLTFSGCSASELGGGMYDREGSPTLTNVIFTGCSAMDSGGLECDGGDISPTLTNVTFDGCSAFGDGGGMSSDTSGSPTLTNVIFSGCSANYGGGVYFAFGSPTLTNVTFSGNSATGVDGSGGIEAQQCSMTLTNCILWGDAAGEIGDSQSSITVAYSDVQGGWSGAGNLNADPLFFDAAAGNLHLQIGSPAIGSGASSFAPSGANLVPSFDRDGYPRPAGGPTDMGAYQLVPTSISVRASSTAKVYGQSVTLTATVTTPAGDPVPTASDGVVTFYDGTKVLGSKTLSGSPSTATLTTTALSAGSHMIFATYSGDSNFAASPLQSVVPATGLVSPESVAVDGQGDVFIADTGNNRVVEVTPSGTQTSISSFYKFVSNGAGGGSFMSVNFYQPNAVSFDGTNISIADGSGALVEMVNGVPFAFGSGSSLQPYMATDGQGDVFFADPTNNRVDELPAVGIPTTIGAGLNQPMGVAVDGQGHLFIADTGNNRVVEVQTGVAVTVSRKVLVVTGITAGNKVYDGTTIAKLGGLGAAKLTGLLPGDHVTLSTTGAVGSFVSRNAGTGIAVNVTGLTLGGAQEANYIATTSIKANITPAALTVTAASNTKIYDGTKSASTLPVITAGKLMSTDTAVFAEAYAGKNVGAGLILIPTGTINDGNGGHNYNVTFRSAAVGKITARPITMTAVTNSKTYDGSTHAPVTPIITSGNLAGGDSFNFVEIYSSKNVGAGLTLTPSGAVLDGNGGHNYAVTIQSLKTGSITPRTLTVTSNATKVYGKPNPILKPSYAGFAPGESATVLTGAPSLTTAATTGSGVGSYAINVAPGTLKDVNYTFVFDNGALSVTPATLTVTVQNASRVYGANNPTFTDTITGFVNGDKSSVVQGAADLNTTATPASGVGKYAITAALGTLNAANYTFKFVGGTLSVTRATLTITANNVAWVIGQAEPALTYSISGLVNGDSVTPVLVTTATGASSAGKYPITLKTVDNIKVSSFLSTGRAGVFAVNLASLDPVLENYNVFFVSALLTRIP